LYIVGTSPNRRAPWACSCQSNSTGNTSTLPASRPFIGTSALGFTQIANGAISGDLWRSIDSAQRRGCVFAEH